MTEEEQGAFAHVDVFEGDDGQGYYVPVYRNGKKGPRSEGYADGIRGAHDAAERDYPELEIYTRLDSGE